MEERSLIHTDETLEFACVVKTICDEYDVDPKALKTFPPAHHVLSLSTQVKFKRRLVVKIPLTKRLAPEKLSADPHLRLSGLRAAAPDAHSLYTSTSDASQTGRLGTGLGEFELTKGDKKIQFWIWNGAQDYYMFGGQSTYFVRKDDVLALTFFIKRAQRQNRRPVDTPILPSEMIAEIYKNSVGFLLKGRDMQEKYKKYRIPYKRGILLSGKPGCVTGDTKIRIRKKSCKGTHKIHDGYEEASYHSEARTAETEDYKVIPNPQTHQIVKAQASKFGISIEQYHDLFLQWVGQCTIANLNWEVNSDCQFNTWLRARLEK